MGKKVFNAKARRNTKSIVNNSAIKDIKLDLPELAEHYSCAGYNDSNALVLPSKKKVTKINVTQKNNIKILSKKQRKHLQRIVDKKKKKEERTKILAALSNFQLPADELKQYTSISKVQTLGIKKIPNINELLAKKCQRRQAIQNAGSAEHFGKISSIKGAAKRKLLLEEKLGLETKRKNPNILSIKSDTDSESEELSESKNDDKYDQKVKIKHDCVLKSEGNEIKQVQPLTVAKEDKCSTKISTVYIPVFRDAKIQAARLKLPILAEEQQIMEVIKENDIVIIAGETGSGKTTQIPQFLYEAGYANNGKIIGVTEPRRVAAIAMSERVGREMNLSTKEVSYLIRFEGNATPDTQIKFMTDGVLLKEIESDFMLKKYSVIILDEVHERSAYTDILIGLLSRIVPLRIKRGCLPLKLILMSATLRVNDFTNNIKLFKRPPPLVNIESRQFPVTVHFQKITPSDYVNEAFKKTAKIHANLPDGGILIFVTGKQEVTYLVRKLRKAFPYTAESEMSHDVQSQDNKGQILDCCTNQLNKNTDERVEATEFNIELPICNVRKVKKKLLSQLVLPKINLDDYKLPEDDTEGDLLELIDDNPELASINNGSDANFDEELYAKVSSNCKQPLWVLPLYSLLSTEKQNRIFQPPPDGSRLCIVSTNVAETSLTIPNIKYVVDSGRQKTRLYDKITGVSSFVVTYTSKASANQRAGRAGRISAGHCYRLYSSAVFNNEFEDFHVPDIQKKPVDDLMLQMRCMGIERVVNFPFPSPPCIEQLQAAERRLQILGALEIAPKSINTSKDLALQLTRLGRIIAQFPLSPRFGKMVVLSHQHNLLPYTVCLVAALCIQEIIIEKKQTSNEGSPHNNDKWLKERLSWASSGQYRLLGDPMVLLKAVGAAEYANSKNQLNKFCIENGLRIKAIAEIRKLRRQLTNEINLNLRLDNLCVDPKMLPPTDSQAYSLRQILLAGMGDKVAHKVPLCGIGDKDERRRLKYAYNCLDMEAPAFIHSSSILKQKLPEWIIYQEAFEIQNGNDRKMFLRGITAIEPEWLLIYVPLLCNIKTIREDPLPVYNCTNGKIYCYVEATFGKAAWELPLTEVEMPTGEKAFCYFAMFFLDAQVCPELNIFKTKLKFTPEAVVKSWSNLNECILRFKRAIINKQIDTRQKLMDEWHRNPNYLIEEYYNMLHDVSYSELTPLWSTLQK